MGENFVLFCEEYINHYQEIILLLRYINNITEKFPQNYFVPIFNYINEYKTRSVINTVTSLRIPGIQQTVAILNDTYAETKDNCFDYEYFKTTIDFHIARACAYLDSAYSFLSLARRDFNTPRDFENAKFCISGSKNCLRSIRRNISSLHRPRWPQQ